MQVPLSSPIIIAGREVAAIELRPPGRRLFDVMRTARGPVRFSEAAVIRFSARLSGHGESTIRRLQEVDLVAAAKGVEELYAHARRRFAMRSALADTAKAAAKVQRQAGE